MTKTYTVTVGLKNGDKMHINGVDDFKVLYDDDVIIVQKNGINAGYASLDDFEQILDEEYGITFK